MKPTAAASAVFLLLLAIFGLLHALPTPERREAIQAARSRARLKARLAVGGSDDGGGDEGLEDAVAAASAEAAHSRDRRRRHHGPSGSQIHGGGLVAEDREYGDILQLTQDELAGLVSSTVHAVLQRLPLPFGPSSTLGHGGLPGGGKGELLHPQLLGTEAPLDVPHQAEPRCHGTLGTWCADFLGQTPLPAQEPPLGDRICPNDCNGGAGVCNAATGFCLCTAGWAGEDCGRRERRPCTDRHRHTGSAPTEERDIYAKGWTASRCAGVCDDDTATCYCNGTFGRIPAPPGSPPGTPPLRRGRPMIESGCSPILFTKDGEKAWGDTPAERIFGPQGWCEAEAPLHHCACKSDGQEGPGCGTVTEMACLNQCSGRGECELGFCRCHAGWSGADCAVRHAALEDAGPGLEVARTWLRPLVAPPSAYAKSRRLRPLIYVYDMPAPYVTRMLQYRVDKGACFWRRFGADNGTHFNQWSYMVESLFHELLLQSPHRTLDPEEADFFYVPVYTSCFLHPVNGWADHPWWHGPSRLRVAQTANMLLEAKRWLETTHPWWQRHGGRDHIWLLTHDEGACWAPTELWPSILLTHWGRLDKEHTSNTAYPPDNYTSEEVNEWQPEGWLKTIQGHPCYDPAKDLVIPVFKPDHAMGPTPLLGDPALNRSRLAFFRGDMGEGGRLPHYSRGIRQRIHAAAKSENWAERYGIHVGTRWDTPGDYSDMLRTSRFCLVLPGDGYSPRAEDAVLHGCIPVVIQDNVDPVFGSILDWDAFGLRIKEADVERLPELLGTVPLERVARLQRGLAAVWHRFAFTNIPVFRDQVKERYAAAQRRGDHGDAAWMPASLLEDRSHDDAFATVLQWLHSRIPATR